MYRAVKTVVLFVMITPFLMYADYVPGVVLIRLKPGIVELPQGETEGNIESIIGNENLKIYLTNMGLTKIAKVFPKFNTADTMTQLKGGEIVHVQDLSLNIRGQVWTLDIFT